MANREPGAGYGVEAAKPIDSSWNNTSSLSPWTNLPLPVCAALGTKVDATGLRTMRQVCTQWLNNIDESVGLIVKVDDREEGNLDFVKRVRVGSALVCHWTEDIGAEPASRLFQYPGWLKKLKLSGKMPAQWKIHYLQQFPNLAHLVLRDSALCSNNLSGHQYPVLQNFDLTSHRSPDATVKRAYETQDPPSEAQPIELKNLRTLEIVFFISNFNFYSLPTHSYLLMTANICFILSHVTSPLLSVVNVTLKQPYSISLKKKLNWTLEPVHKFFNSHRTTLHEVILTCPTVKSSDLIKDESLSNSFPVNLQKLSLNIKGPEHNFYSRDPPVQTTFTYLEKCLQGQTQLQDVKFHFNSFPTKWISDAFTALANSCGQTLRYLELQGYPVDNTSIDLEILSVCQSLQVFHVPEWHHASRSTVAFRNVDKLPVSLKRLVIHCSHTCVEIGDPSYFERLTVLEWLCLGTIRQPGADNVGYPEPRLRYFRTMIKSLLGLRQLQGFDLKTESVVLTTDRNLLSVLRPLNPDFNEGRRYERGWANFNLTYPQYINTVYGTGLAEPPWSEKPFDESTWDLERLQDGDRPQVEQDSDDDDDDDDDVDDVDEVDDEDDDGF